jgi:hypothetical protein
MKTLIIVAALGIALSMDSSSALAQAGSAGGAAVKQDKSVSGGEEAAEPPHAGRRAEPTPRQPSSTDRQGITSKALSVSGKWIWHGKCADDSEWAGTFDLEQNKDGTVSGTCSAVRESCSSIAGEVIGNKATLDVGWAYSTGTLQFTLSEGGRSMSGWEMGRYHGRCSYQAHRS